MAKDGTPTTLRQAIVAIERLRQSEDQLLSQVARNARLADTRHKEFARMSRKLRAREKAIRYHAFGHCKCETKQECLVRLAKDVPLNDWE